MAFLIVWPAAVVAILAAFVLAAQSPQLAFRQPVYVVAGLSGVAALALLLVQPLLAGGLIPRLNPVATRRAHKWAGLTLVAMVLIHVITLWVTSPPDVIDALLLRSPTQFSLWGVIAMWAVFVAAAVALLRRKLWRIAHRALAPITVAGTIAHALLIDGTMEPVSKLILCIFAALATLYALTSPPWRT